MVQNPLAKINLRWTIISLLTVVLSTGVGFFFGLWLGS